MKKMCKRGRNWVQVYTSDGIVRECSWLEEAGKIGSLLENSLSEIYHGEKARRLRERLADQDYSSCKKDSCPYLMTGEIKDMQVEMGEIPEYPEELRIAFESACNYRCISCTVCKVDKDKTREQIEHNYDIIESRLREAMPHVKSIGANGYGELFCSKRILRLLSEWKPLAPAEECEAWLETNGSLFDAEHWKQIENLGNYFLGVTLTVMSFNEPTYQRLSGVNYP
ncbi:MAG: SPASM domain-containing protein, partial [bacterium]|nr:SPASM domain-containing protein [bacterium]